jgi:hypothetical protein
VAAWGEEVANVAGSLDDGWDIQTPLHEHELYWWSRRSGSEPTTLPGMAVLLLLVAARLGSPATAADYAMDWDLVTEGGVARLGMSRFFMQLRRQQMAQDSIGALLGWLYRDYVIRQHQQVAVTKLPDDTFRFRRDGDRLRFFQHHAEAGMNNSRFEALPPPCMNSGSSKPSATTPTPSATPASNSSTREIYRRGHSPTP